MSRSTCYRCGWLEESTRYRLVRWRRFNPWHWHLTRLCDVCRTVLQRTIDKGQL